MLLYFETSNRPQKGSHTHRSDYQRKAFCLQVKTWFQNRRMKHKKQLRKLSEDAKHTGAERASTGE